MPRFFFHFRDGESRAADDCGLDFASLEAAYLSTFQAAQDIWRERLIERRDPRLCAFDIADAAGTILMTVPFAEVLEACNGSPRKSPRGRGVRVHFADIVANADRAKRLAREVFVQLAETRKALEEARQLVSAAESFPDQQVR